MRRLLPLLLSVALPAVLAAQSSEFGTRGLGIPGREESVRTLGTGGSFGLFDPTSSLNPAALGDVFALTATFTGTENFRSSSSPGGSVSGRDTRFPQVTAAGPVGRRPFAVGMSYSTYTDRDFSVATSSEIMLRGVPVTSYDTLSSRGGLNDLQVGVAYRGLATWRFGAALHILTGSARTVLHRQFSDSGFVPVHQQAEISYAGAGISLGITHNFGPKISVAAVARSDGNANVDRDSTRVNRVGLPSAFGAAVRVQTGARLTLAAEGMYHTWTQASAALEAGGGTGASRTTDLSFGGEYITNLRQPVRRPIRFGVHYSQLPFPVNAGERPSEFGASLGSGVRILDSRTHREVAGLDLAIEHVWRREAAAYRETAWLVSFGVTIKP